MKWTELVLTELRGALDFTLTTMDIYPLIDAITVSNKGAVRSALSRLAKKNIIERISRGTYRLLTLFRLFRHTKRVVETHRTKKQRSYNLDIEATSEGFVPVRADENRIINVAKFSKTILARQAALKIMEEIIKRVEKVINPKLIEETMRLLASTDPSIFLGFTASEDALSEVEFQITGSEFKRDLSADYQSNHDVEVILINDVGARYVFTGNFFVTEGEYE